MKMNYMVIFKLYNDKVKDKFLDGLKKDLHNMTVLTSQVDNDDDEDLGGKSIRARVSDCTCSSGSKIIVGTSIDGDLHKRVAFLKAAMLDVATFIREERLKRNQKEKQQQEQEDRNDKE